MRSKFVSVAVVVVLALSMFACGGSVVKVNPAAQFPLPISEQTPGFLFPINMSHLGSAGDPLAMGLAVSGGVIGKFGKTLISGQQLFDLVGNLSYELAETVDAQVRNGSFEMSGSAEPIASALANLMEQIIAKLVELKLLDTPIKFKYIIVLHSHGESSMGGKMLKVNSWGGIYDSETKQILSYINDISTYANEETALLGQIPLAYNAILEKLIQGPAEKK